jgi:hypothetical protein
MQPVVEPFESDVTVETGELGAPALIPVRIELLLCEDVAAALRKTMSVSSGDPGRRMPQGEKRKTRHASHRDGSYMYTHTHIPRTKRIP